MLRQQHDNLMLKYESFINRMNEYGSDSLSQESKDDFLNICTALMLSPYITPLEINNINKNYKTVEQLNNN